MADQMLDHAIECRVAQRPHLARGDGALGCEYGGGERRVVAERHRNTDLQAVEIAVDSRAAAVEDRHARHQLARHGRRRNEAPRRLDERRRGRPTDEGLLERIALEIKEMCASFPAPGILT